MALFTPEELAELAAADAELEEEFVQTMEEIRQSRERDKEAALEGLDHRAAARKRQQRAYYEANRERLVNAGSVIRAYRKEKGLSGEAFGNLFGVTRSCVSLWEKGKTPADMKKIREVYPDLVKMLEEKMQPTELYLRRLQAKCDTLIIGEKGR